MKMLRLIIDDPWLQPFQNVLDRRNKQIKEKIASFSKGKKSLSDAVNGHLYYGLHKLPDQWVIREWAPNAEAIFIVGEFSDWKPLEEFRFTRIENDNWECYLPPEKLKHKMLYKLHIEWNGGSGERIPAYCTRVVQDETTKIFSAQVWDPEKQYEWKYPVPPKVEQPLVYETHVGMATNELKTGTYNEFRKNVLPRINKLGYNTIQLMAIQEHPYYGSFGYQVSNFFAPSSRFGTPDDLKALIDEAHKMGISVVLDIVHSHAVKNEVEGLSRFDGTDYQYFHAGAKGDHPIWDSRVFNYGKDEVLNFLLSNCKYWLDEFHFDGFRFDGVTSMLYFHHGLGVDFVDYGMYFNGEQDEDALTYLAMANQLIHENNPSAISIAEDISGMPGLASPIENGGLGFDFRMAMGVTDFWIKTIKEKKDEDWHVGDIYFQLTNKRSEEKTISYAECHDQAMVGDKTIIFRLMDDKMYFSMAKNIEDLVVERGMALHKMIRLATLATAGDGYLNFMGNEFGHPEWIDFPRVGNGWSFFYARRQWNLVDDKKLRYSALNEFDKAMIHLVKQENILSYYTYSIVQNIPDQVLIFKRGSLIFIFNFNPFVSFTDYGFEIDKGTYQVVLNSDAKTFDGVGRNDDEIRHFTVLENNKSMLKIYLPSRSALVFKKTK